MFAVDQLDPLAPSRDFEIPTREEALEYNAQAPQLTTDRHDVTADDWVDILST
jgi:hypothetical protein